MGNTTAITRKTDDPRYTPGVSKFDDDATDQEWFEATGPAPTQDAPDEDLGPVCEDCMKHLPDDQIATKDILCEDCQEADDSPEFTETQMTKQKELWVTVDDHAGRALAIAWDGCHKVYLLMDAGQVQKMHDNGYGKEGGDSALVTNAEASPGEMQVLAHEWFEASCGLRFISAATTTPEDPNAGFKSLISQDDNWEFFTPDDDSEEDS